MKKSISKIEKYGFVKSDEDSDYVVTLEYNDFTIEIEADIDNDDEENLTIGTIILKAESEYLGNRLY